MIPSSDKRREEDARQAEEERVRQAAETKARLEAEERARQEAERRRAALRKLVSTLPARDIAQLVAEETGVALSVVAARIAEIPHEEWVALAVGDEREAAA